MKIEVVNTKKLGESSAVVISFSCAIGEGRARWSTGAEPQVGSEWIVEFDLDGEIGDFFPEESEAGVYSVEAVEGGTRLCGLLESVDPDGVGYLRLREDCLTLIETSPPYNTAGFWLCLTVRTEKLAVTGHEIRKKSPAK